MSAAFTVAGTAKVVRFNWPKFMVVGASIVGAAAVGMVDLHPLVVATVRLSALVGTAGAVLAVVATWWVYDHRRIYDRVGAGLGDVGRWASVHGGFDDATPNLVRTLGRAPAAIVELSAHAGPSLRRAIGGRPSGGVPGRPGSIPLPTASVDTLFLTFAAHEIRDPADQRALFAELRRVLAGGGRLVVTEHLRDVPNAAVYGPGAWHFQPRRTWLELGRVAGLRLEGNEACTPFVRRLVWRR